MQDEPRKLDPETRVYLTDVNSALQEAGHLAAASSRDIPARARIGWDRFSSGRTDLDLRNSSLDSGLFLTFAGVAMPEKHHLRKLGLFLDIKDIEDAVAHLPVEEATAIKAKVREDAEGFVEQYQPVNFQLARALLIHRHLDKHMAKEIFTGVVDIEIPEDFYEGLKLLPCVNWTS
jgi:hypothetical protein